MYDIVEHGYLKGNRLVEQQSPAAASKPDDDANTESKGPRKLIDLVVETVSKCSDEADDGVQLQVRDSLYLTHVSCATEVTIVRYCCEM